MTDVEPEHIDGTPRRHITGYIEATETPSLDGALRHFGIEATEENKAALREVFATLEVDPATSTPGVDAETPAPTDGGNGSTSAAADTDSDDTTETAVDGGDADGDTGATGRRERSPTDGAADDPDGDDDGAEGDEDDEANPLKTDEDLKGAVGRVYNLGLDDAPADERHEAAEAACREAARHGDLTQYRVARLVTKQTDLSETELRNMMTVSQADDDTGVEALDVVDGGYAHRQKNRDGEVYYEQMTNFTMTVCGRLRHPQDGWVIDATVHPSTDEDAYDVQVPTTAFNDPRRFKQAVVTGLTTTFDGRSEKLNLLREHLGTADAPVREGVTTFGVHADGAELVVPDGTLTADGWVNDPETVYISRGVGAEESSTLSPERHDPDDVDREAVTEILRLLPRTRDPERFLPVLGWFYAAPTRPLVTTWTDEFNICTVMGDSGAGKSASIETLCRLLGMDGQAFSPEDTEYAMTATVSSTNALPVFYDEYNPADIHPSALDRFHRHVRKSTRGGVEQRGRPDGSTRRYELTAPVVIAGEEEVAGPAEQRRAIPTTFRKRSAAPGTETAVAFAHLAGGTVETPDGDIVQHEGLAEHYTDHAVAYHSWLLGMDAADVRARWHGAGDRVRDLLGRTGITGLDAMRRQGLQTVTFGVGLYHSFAEAMGVSDATLDATVGDDALDDALLYAIRHGVDLRREVSFTGDETIDVNQAANYESHLDRFIDLCGRAAARGALTEDHHYTFVHSGTAAEELRINLSRTYDAVSKYVRDHDLDDELLQRNAYAERIKDEADDPESYVACWSRPTKPINRSFGITVDEAGETIESFERGDWTTSHTGGKYRRMDDKKAVACIVEDYTGGSDDETIREGEVLDRARENGIDRERAAQFLDEHVTDGRIEWLPDEDAYTPRR